MQVQHNLTSTFSSSPLQDKWTAFNSYSKCSTTQALFTHTFIHCGLRLHSHQQIVRAERCRVVQRCGSVIPCPVCVTLCRDIEVCQKEKPQCCCTTSKQVILETVCPHWQIKNLNNLPRHRPVLLCLWSAVMPLPVKVKHAGSTVIVSIHRRKIMFWTGAQCQTEWTHSAAVQSSAYTTGHNATLGFISPKKPQPTTAGKVLTFLEEETVFIEWTVSVVELNETQSLFRDSLDFYYKIFSINVQDLSHKPDAYICYHIYDC